MEENISLSELYENLLSKKTTPEEASDIMKSSYVQSLIRVYINKDKVNSLVPYFEEDLQNIYMIINIAQFIYNNSGYDTGISDNDYDILYAIMLENSGRDVVSVPIVPKSGNIAHHKYPALRGTLLKTYYLTNDEVRTNPSRKYLDEWKNTMETLIYNKTGEHINLDNEEVYIFPKFDGVSCVFEMTKDGIMERALTRGYTKMNEAEDISHVFAHMPKRRYKEFNSDYGLKTEIMMKISEFDKFNITYGTNYKDTRSIVSAILNSNEYDREKSEFLEIVPLRVGTEEGLQEIASEAFEKYPYLRCKLRDRERIRKFAYENAYVNGELRCD